MNGETSDVMLEKRKLYYTHTHTRLITYMRTDRTLLLVITDTLINIDEDFIHFFPAPETHLILKVIVGPMV